MQNRTFWDQQAALPGLRSVIDPNDLRGHRNAYLDCLHKTVLRRAGRFASRHRVLDFGCGPGRISRWLAARVATVHAVDGSLDMVRRARREVGAEVRNVLFCPYDGVYLPLRPASFDRLTAIWVLQHVVDETSLSEVLGELARVLRPAGRALFMERISDDPVEPWTRPELLVRRPLAVYERFFEKAGLVLERAIPVWDEGPVWHRARVERLLVAGRIPRGLFPVIAYLDLFLRPRSPFGNWTDYLLVCGKDGRRSEAAIAE
jgi:SAM-dependent methyltransferase